MQPMLLISRITLKGWLIIACYLISIGATVSVAAYGLAWHQYVEESKRQNVRNEGFDGEGTVTALRGFGIWRYKDFYLRIDSFPTDISIPAVIASDLLIPDAFPKADVGGLVRVGDRVKVHTLGGRPPISPVIIYLGVYRDGKLQEVVNWGASSRRFELIEAQGRALGDRIVAKAKFCLAFGPLGHLLLWAFFRFRRLRPSIAGPVTE